MRQILRNHWPLIILFLFALFLSSANYTSNTFLSGWDTLHPEFNFSLNIKRVLFGVFRQEQGLGAVAGHSHMADLPRILFLYLMHFILPLNFLRYSYIFITLIIGPLGMYLFLKKIVVKQTTPSFLGALFYLLNLGTMQTFFVPFEMFTTQYAFLPWLFFFATDYLQTKKLKALILFSFITILSAPMAYAATLWYVYFFVFAIYLLTFSLQAHAKKPLLKQTIILLLLTLVLNAYWLLPNLYFIKTHGQEVTQANINKLFSSQAFLYNKEFGNLKEISLLKTFLFDWNVYVGNNSFENLLTPWINYLANPYIQTLGYLLATVALFGAIYALFRKNSIALALFSPLIFCLFLLFNVNPPLGFLYNFLQKAIPLFGEALRFPDDKALGIFTFIFAVYFSFGQLIIEKIFLQIGKTAAKILEKVQLIAFTTLLVFFMLPAFKGYLISPYMRIQIPQEYFQLFNWFNKQEDDGRIANLPIHSLWGWEYYDWYSSRPSFQGAGFLWFGIKQPFLARDFDRWSPYNEQYYREMSYAVYTQDPILISLVIKKYNIHYLLLDTNVTAPESNLQILFYPQLKNALETLERNKVIKKTASFGKISIYHTNETLVTPPASPIESLALIEPAAKVLQKDFVYENYGNYITPLNNTDPVIKYPFRSLTYNNGQVLPNILQDTSEGIKINPPEAVDDQKITPPTYINNQDQLPASVTVEKTQNQLKISFYPYSLFHNIYYSPLTASFSLTKQFPKTNQQLVLTINQKDSFIVPSNLPASTFLGNIFLNTKTDNDFTLSMNAPKAILTPDFSDINFSLAPCNPGFETKLFGINVTKSKNGFSIFAKDTLACMMIPFENIPNFLTLFNEETTQKEMLINLRFQYKGSDPSAICVANLLTGTCIKSLHAPSDYFGMKKEDIKTRGVKIVLDAANQTNLRSSPFGQLLEKSKKEKYISYENISLDLIKPIFQTNLSSTALQQTITPLNNVNLKNQNIVIPIPTDNKLNNVAKGLLNAQKSCQSSISTKTNNQKKLIEKDGKNYIEYNSDLGSLCDNFSYQISSQNTSFLVTITSQNKEGLPLTVCISNPISKRCGIYASLPDDKKITKTAFLLPPDFNNQIGIDININNFAIKQTPSINQLYSIEIVPFPYTWLSKIAVFPDKQANKTDKNVLAYFYSFEEGWKAYAVKNYESEIMNYAQLAFPFLLGKELKEHILVNNWANGWNIDDSELKTKNYKLVIIYLPQYLEYIGFVLLIGTFVFLIASRYILNKN